MDFFRLKEYYQRRKVLVTGHTGFKGSWLCKLLLLLGAEVYGYSSDFPTVPNLYSICDIDKHISSCNGDIRDLECLSKFISSVKPEVIIHMAAQPIVRESYINPVYTYETNVIGTVNMLECVRHTDCIRTVVNVTTDKVYKNCEQTFGYKEDDELDGYDPYSNSKSCSELVTSSYIKSFFLNTRDVAISTCRAGNVIGGGDFSKDRIIPDCIRAAIEQKNVIIRQPDSVRPYQYVIEPVVMYIFIAMMQDLDKNNAGAYNIGPDETDCFKTAKLVELFSYYWNIYTGKDLKYIIEDYNGPHETCCLKLDCSKIKDTFDWKPRWNIEEAVRMTAEWTYTYMSSQDINLIMDRQLNSYFI